MNNILNFIILFELFILLFLWFIYYYPEWAWNFINECDWYVRLISALICYYTLGKSSSLTWTKEDGEIVKQIFIGY
jgi:hypothetical protein